LLSLQAANIVGGTNQVHVQNIMPKWHLATGGSCARLNDLAGYPNFVTTVPSLMMSLSSMFNFIIPKHTNQSI